MILAPCRRTGPFVCGDASLWVDGKRIYEATGLGMRIVGPEDSA